MKEFTKEFIIRTSIPEEIEFYEEEETPELVRCKDCKYWQTNTQFCTRWSAPFATQHTSPDWFCADGERKDGDGDA